MQVNSIGFFITYYINLNSNITMKKLKTQYTILTLIACYFLFNGCLPRKAEVKPKEFVFIWNDDQESIPMDGSKVVIEFTEGNKIYLGSVEANEE